MDTKTHTPHIAQPLLCLLFYGLIKSEEFHDLRLVFQEEVVPTGVPPFHHHQFSRKHQLFLIARICLFLIKAHRRNQSPLGSILGKDIGQEVVMRRMTDMKPRILVGKSHRHRLAPMLSSPSIHVSVLQHIIGHTAFIVNEDHNNPFLAFSSSTVEVISTRPVASS